MTEAILKGKCAKKMPVCGLYAVAHLAGVSLDDVYNHVQKKNKKAKHWKGRTQFGDRAAAIKKFLKVEPFKTERQSLRSFIYDTAHINKKFLVRTTGHVQVVERGIVTDQQGTFQPNEYWGINKRVIEMFIFKGAR